MYIKFNPVSGSHFRNFSKYRKRARIDSYCGVLYTQYNLSLTLFQLRYLQTLNNISAEKNSTIVFPVPVDIITSLMNGWQKNNHSS